MQFTARRGGRRNPYHLHVVTGETANDVQGSYGHPIPPNGPVPGWPVPLHPVAEGRARERGSVAATATLMIALTALIVAVIGVSIQLLPRQFTQAQQQKIMAWEVAGRWRDLSAGQVFPVTIRYG